MHTQTDVQVPTTSPSAALSADEPGGLVNRIYGSLSTNPYFSAGAGLAGIGIAMSVGKRAAIVGNALFRRRFVTSLQLNNEDAAYPWVLEYINRHSRNKARNISVSSRIRQSESGRISSTFNLLPGHGTHFFTYNYRWVQVERQREKQTIQRDGIRTPLETVTLTTIGVGPAFWKDFLELAAKEALAKVETGLVVYNAIGPEWRRFGNARRKRPLDSVILDTGVSESIVKDVTEFLGSGKWYAERGIPYRRGYLLYGPPGTGKSSFISALAGHFGYSICMVSLSERTLDDDRLNYLLNNTPPNTFILLEDVDAAFVSRDLYDNTQHKAYEGMTRVTLSGLLNAIDGVASSEERVLFLTTNYVDRLDPALIRPGRVDVKQHLGNCTPYMLEQMFKRFYEDVSDELCKQFRDAALALNRPLSPAQIQGHLLLHKTSPKDAIATMSQLT